MTTRPPEDPALVRREAVFHPEFRQSVRRDPFSGIGKPKPLRHLDPRIWPRRLTEEHRVVYRVADQRIDFLLARYHY